MLRCASHLCQHGSHELSYGRLFETEQLLKFLAGVKGPTIVVADLNDVPAGSAYQLMRTKFDDAWVTSGARTEGFSYPADKPAKRIDHIFYRQGDRMRARKSWVIETLACDHIPVMAELEIK
jgi:endonuclease/exonuclease/phosphatase (EEP) superfamily protein YafD